MYLCQGNLQLFVAHIFLASILKKRIVRLSKRICNG